MRTRNLAAAAVLVVSSVLAQPSSAAPRSAPQTPEDAMREVIAYDRRGGDDELFNRGKFTPTMRRLLSENFARDWIAAIATGENVLDADVFSAKQSTTASNKYSNIKQINSDGRTAQVEATMYTVVDDVGYSHPQIFTFVYEEGGWRLDEINYGPGLTRPLLLHEHVRTFIKPGTKPAVKEPSKFGPTVDKVFVGGSAGGPAKPEIDKWFLTKSSIKCVHPNGAIRPCTLRDDTKFQIFYSFSGTDAIVFVNYLTNRTGNGVSQAVAIAHKRGVDWDVRDIPKIMGEKPTTVVFAQNEVTFSTAVLRDDDARCCPTGRQSYRIPLSSTITSSTDAAGPERFRVELRGSSSDGAKSGFLTFERTATVTRWELVCTDTTSGNRYTRSGTAPAEKDWVMGTYDGPGGKGNFTLALRTNARLWMTSLEGCPGTIRFPPVIKTS